MPNQNTSLAKVAAATKAKGGYGTELALAARRLVNSSNIVTHNPDGFGIVPVNGAIPVAAGVTILTKGSAAAMTLAAPVLAQNGLTMIIVAGSAYAHVVTATARIDDGVTGGSKTTATFAAFVGASLTLMASNLKWVVVSNNNVTIS